MCDCMHGYKGREWRMMSRPSRWQQAAGNRWQAAGSRRDLHSHGTYKNNITSVVREGRREGGREGVREIATEVTAANQPRERHGMGGSEGGSMGGCEGRGESGVRVVAVWWQ